MAKRTRNDDTDDRLDERNPPADDRAPEQTSTGYNPFLKAEDLDSKSKHRLELTGWVRRTVGRYGPQVVIEVRDATGRTWDLGVKDGSPNHRMIWRGMGRDETKWAGALIVEVQRFKIGGGRAARMSNPAIAIVEVESDQPF